MTENQHPGLDPTPYQAEIEAVESRIYKAAPAELADFDGIGTALLELGSSLAENVHNPQDRQYARQVLALAAHGEISGDAGYALPDMKAIRELWEAARDETFQPVDWFQEATAELVSAQTPAKPEVDWRRAFAVESSLDRLEELIRRGERDVERLGEPQYPLERPGLAGEAHVRRWNKWARAWDESINDAMYGLPPQPSPSDNPNFFHAIQSLGQAAGELRLVPYGAGSWPTPFRYQWEQRFGSARAAIAEAREYLAKTRQG